MRLFVAIPLPHDVATAAAALVPDRPAVRRVRPEAMHLTLAFLGDVEAPHGDAAAAAMAAAARAHGPFALRLDHLGRFPPAGAPRVFWLGAGAGREALQSLGGDVRSALAEAGLRFDDRPLQAHVTLARVRETARREDVRDVAAALDRAGVTAMDVPVREIELLESVIGHDGPRYTRRAAAVLGEVGGSR